MTTYRFRAGDTVLHEPSGETWTLAVDEVDGELMPAGHPASRAKASDCQLINRATPGDHLRMLKDAAKRSGPWRHRARVQLKEMGIEPETGGES